MIRNPLAPARPVALSQTDIDHITTIARQVYADATIEALDRRVVITTNHRGQRDLIQRRLRTLGYIVRANDTHFAAVIGWDPDHPSARALSAEELDERIAHLQALRAQITTVSQ